MARRPRRATAPSAYRYANLEECEENGNHRVTPGVWPPPRTSQSGTDPTLSVQCELCGAWVVVYEAHATGGMDGVDVILPSGRPEAVVQS